MLSANVTIERLTLLTVIAIAHFKQRLVYWRERLS